jgi:hypothetical protein
VPDRLEARVQRASDLRATKRSESSVDTASTDNASWLVHERTVDVGKQKHATRRERHSEPNRRSTEKSNDCTVVGGRGKCRRLDATEQHDKQKRRHEQLRSRKHEQKKSEHAGRSKRGITRP